MASNPIQAVEDHAAPAAELLDRGYCVLRDLLPSGTIDAINEDLEARFAATPFCEGGFYGPRTKRFGGLLKRSPTMRDLVMHPAILATADAVLGPWCDTIQLNLTQALELHPGAPAQFPHRDQDMWRGQSGETEYLLNVMWPLSPFTADNGATLMWPSSHNRGDMGDGGDALAIEADAGSAILFLGSTLHGAGANRTEGVRRGIIISYCLGWLKPYENQWLTYPPDIAAGFAPDLAALVGYRQHRPNLGNVDGQCPSILLNGVPAEHLAAIDALRPDQEEALNAFLIDQRLRPAPPAGGIVQSGGARNKREVKSNG